ncbi:MAG TPA: protein kinase [Vicinamibacterales bacterium]|jgi:serine/threonine protein kinase
MPIAAVQRGRGLGTEPGIICPIVPVAAGSRLGPYEVVSPLGRGGMGEVWRARDTKLNRDVALKILPEAFSLDADRLTRFKREAQVLASLNNPHIGAIYGFEDSDGIHALVLELVDGPTLADRIREAPVPIDEALGIARQIADALEYAHERGIVHRDLKPANVKVAGDDTVKILDFGLAKALASDLSAEDIADSPTITQMATEAGVLLGTAAYMSPEQARAKRVDRRADIWAFGCVLYEMLTGKMAFRGDSVTDTLAAVLKNEPDWSRLPPATPQHIRVLVRRCLQKDARQRLQAMGDARIALDEVLSGAPEGVSSAGVSPAPWWRRTLRWSIAGGAVIAALAFLSVLVITLNAPSRVSGPLNSEQITFSADRKDGPILTDGTRVYFQSQGHPVEMSVNGGPMAPLRASVSGLTMLDISPDASEMLALKRDLNDDNNRGSLWSVPVLGGSPRMLGNQTAQRAHWSPDGRSLVYADVNSVFVSRGDGANLRKIWDAPGPTDLPYFSPDSSRVRVTVRSNPVRIWELNVDGGSPHPLDLDWPEDADMSAGQWTPDGKHFVFISHRDGPANIYELIPPRWFEFWQKPYAARLTGGGIDVLAVAPSHDGAGLFTVGQVAQGAMQGFDPEQKRFVPFLGGFAASAFVISPDKKWMAYVDYPLHHLWRSKLDGSEKLRLTNFPSTMPRWSPDSKRVVFSDWWASVMQLYVISADGGTAEKLIPNPNREVWPAWWPDGRSIAFNDFPVSGQLRAIKLLDLATRKISVMPGSEGSIMPTWSPDGEYMVAEANNPLRLVLYSAQSGTWKDLKTFGAYYSNWVWSGDSKSLYIVIQDREAGAEAGVYRLAIADGAWNRIGTLDGINLSRLSTDSFPSITLDDRIVMMSDMSVFQIYYLKWN